MLEDWSVSRMQSLIRRSAFSPYRSISTAIPNHWLPSDPWKGQAVLGQPLASGSHPKEITPDHWHEFSWLRHMREYGGNQARTLARRFITEWIDQHQRWSQEIWHPQLLSTRLKNLILVWDWYGASASTSQQQMIITSMGMQRFALSKDWRKLTNGNNRIDALSTLMLADAFLNPASTDDAAVEQFMQNHLEMLLADGCHASRQPDQHIDLMQKLIESRIALGALASQEMLNKDSSAENTTKTPLQDHLITLDDSITRMGAVARMWRHADGHFMRILGSREINADQVEDILDRAGPKGRVSTHASDAGFIRMASGRSVLMMNTGPSPWALPMVLSAGGQADAGALSIEFSNGTTPIITNAGQSKSLKHDLPDLAEALAGTAAFSTLSIDRTNAADTKARSPQGRHATVDGAETGPASGGLLAEAKHNGYEKSHGLIHQRRVFLATGGNDLRGEDTLLYTGAPGLIPDQAIIRFHLHPKIKASLSMGGDVILRLPGSATPWHFKAQGADVRVEDSVILGQNNKNTNKTDKDGLEKCLQITLNVPLSMIRQDYHKTVKWALRRQPPAAKKAAAQD